MTTQELINYLRQGREIEFFFREKSCFLSADWGNTAPKGEYYIFDNDQKEMMVAGSLSEILAFEFCPGVTLADAINSFSFECIL